MTAQRGRLTRAGVLIVLTAAAGLLSLTAACAPGVTVHQDAPPPSPALIAFEDSGKGWWTVYFELSWDRSKEPEWHLDALLADQVIAPVVAHAEPRILLWRFHRRAANDAGGHRFSFIFYADAETAEIVNNGVDRAPLTAQLRDAGMVRAVKLAELDQAPAQEIGATSDPAWPEAIKRGWPWFIMGVSQSWLRLIDEAKSGRPSVDGASLHEVVEYYREINTAVSTLWREHGQHAYLHHLNAVFGYQFLIIQETNLKRF